jgi:GNAT superfamily N-acetyltransferase
MTEIIKLLPSEAMRFKSIRLRSLKDSPDAFGTRFETAATWDEHNWVSQVEKLNTFIASSEGIDVGVARSAKDENDPKTAWIISMWVAPEARGKKVASKLLQAIIEWAKKENLNSLKLDVVDSNKPAISLYENHGFIANGISGKFPEPRAHIMEHQRELKL